MNHASIWESVHPTPRHCPVASCGGEKSSVELVCRKHWYQVPKLLRDRIWELYQRRFSREEPQRQRLSIRRPVDADHLELCLEMVARLGEPEPQRRWSDLVEAETARIRELTRPAPGPPTDGEAAESDSRRRQAHAGGPVDVICQRLLRETAKAVLFVIRGEEVWVPKSVIESKAQQPDETWWVVVAGWFAQREGLLDG